MYARLSSEHQLHQKPFAAAWSAGFTVLPDGWGQCVKLSTLPLIHNSVITFPRLQEIEMKCKCEYLERESRLDNFFAPARIDTSQTQRNLPLLTQVGMLLSRDWDQLTPWAIPDEVENKVQSLASSCRSFFSAVFSFLPIAPMCPFTNNLEFEHLCNIIFLWQSCGLADRSAFSY